MIKFSTVKLPYILAALLIVVSPIDLFSAEKWDLQHLVSSSVIRQLLADIKIYLLLTFIIFSLSRSKIEVGFIWLFLPLFAVHLFLGLRYGLNHEVLSIEFLYPFVFIVIVLSFYNFCCRYIKRTDDLGAFFFVCFFIHISLLLVEIFVSGIDSVYWSGRFYGLTPNPNHAGVYLLLNLMVILLFYRPHVLWEIVVKWIVLYGGVFLIFETDSRTAIFGFFGFFSLCVLLRLGFSKKQIVTIGFLVFLLGVLIISFDDFSSIYSLGGIDTRSENVNRSLTKLFENPIFGFDDYSNSGYVENSYLAVGEKLGIVGLFLIVWQVVIFLRSSYFSDVRFFVIFITLLVCAFFEAFLLARISFPLFYVLIILISCMLLRSKIQS